MSNSTSSASDQFLAVHSSLAVLFYATIHLPTQVLGALYLVALLRAKGIHSKMKVILINNLIPDLLITVSSSFFYALHPLRAYVIGGRIISCVISSFGFSIGQLDNILATPLFAFAVYVFVKYGLKKLKWYAIAGYILASWGISVASVVPLAWNVESFRSSNGFCENDRSPRSVYFLLSVCPGFLFFACVLRPLSLSLTIVM